MNTSSEQKGFRHKSLCLNWAGHWAMLQMQAKVVE